MTGLEVSVSVDESRAINANTEPKVIISASGMCDAGRIRHHLKHNLWRKESLILFVGYQADGTLGRMLYEGAKEVKLFGEDHRGQGRDLHPARRSGHADKNGLLRWMRGFTEQKPAQVFVNHGDDGVCDAFAQTLSEELGLTAMARGAARSMTWQRVSSCASPEGVPIEKRAAAPSGTSSTTRSSKRVNVCSQPPGSARDARTEDIRKWTERIEALIRDMTG